LNWTVPFLMRAKGITMRNVALYYSLMLAVSIGAGMCSSGWLADKLSSRYMQIYALIPAVASLVAIPFFLAFLYAPTWPVALAFLVVPSCLNIMYLAPAIAIVQNTAPASMRTTAGALLLLGINLIGLGLGPLFIGAVSDWTSPQPGGRSLLLALACLTPFYVLAAGAHLLTVRALKTAKGDA
jgi:MFS family permease